VSDDSTRARVIDAAVACILDEGFYRASSNKIARRAGVTWGVIQYHFGTREALLLAVHERGLDELDRCLADAVITGDSMEERLRSFVEALWGYYRRPEFLAYMQVMLNLSHDPTTADSTQAALKSVGARVNERVPALVRAVLDADLPDAETERIGRFLYNVVRGLALDQELLEAMPIEHSTAQEFDAQRAELVRVLTRALEADC
jgi:TetR/AcrR family transcriptional regulator, regulator of cefoperazone and chloramphenicol sensitivity